MKLQAPLLCLFIATASLIFSCKKSNHCDGELIHDGRILFELVSEVDSRASERTFAIGDVAGVYVYYSANGTLYADNIEAAFDGRVWVPKTPLYWVDEGKELDFSLYYPYSKSGKGETFSTADNQSGENQYFASQYVRASAGSVSPSNGPVKMKFSHLMSSIESRFETGTGITNEELGSLITAVEYRELLCQCAINIKSGAVSNPTSPQNIKAYRVSPTAFRAFIAPQTTNKGGQRWIEVKTSEGAFSFDSPTVDFKSAKRVVANFVVTRSGAGELEMIFKGLDRLSVDKREITVGVVSGSVKVTVNSSVDYRVEISDKSKDWLSIAPQGKAVTASTITLNYTDNSVGTARSGEVYVRYANLIDTVKVSQSTLDLTVTTPGTLRILLEEKGLIEATSLSIAGSINSSDAMTLWTMPNLTSLDVSAADATLPAFNGLLKLETIILPADLNIIKKSAFSGCSSLTSIVIPDGVTSIGQDAFYRCSSLTSIVIPDGVTSIGNEAFRGCSSLTSIVIPDGVTSIGKEAFSNCSKLTSIIIGDGVTSIGQYAFYGCSSVTSIIIGDGVTSIGERAFNGCSFLTSIVIPDGVTAIEGSLFSDCSSLASVVLPNSVTSIGNFAFSGCGFLTSIAIPDSVKSIGSGAFSNCSKLTSIVIPDGVTSIGGSAFNSCSSLTSIVIPDRVTSIGESAFFFCSKLTSITVLPNNSAYKDDDGVLYSKDGKTFITYPEGRANTSYTIENSVTTIPIYSFWSCNSLTSIVIGNGVKSISNYAFNTLNLISVICLATTPPTMSGNNNFGVVVTLKVPSGSVNAYKALAAWSNAFRSIEAI